MLVARCWLLLPLPSSLFRNPLSPILNCYRHIDTGPPRLIPFIVGMMDAFQAMRGNYES